MPFPMRRQEAAPVAWATRLDAHRGGAGGLNDCAAFRHARVLRCHAVHAFTFPQRTTDADPTATFPMQGMQMQMRFLQSEFHVGDVCITRIMMGVQ
ncbi:hypothetical protein AOLI_G00177460 [Acnodon oligacanthus]